MMHDLPKRSPLDHQLTPRELAARDRSSERLALRTHFRMRASWFSDGERSWFLIRHHRRDDESLALEMQKEGIEAWCPLDKERKKVGPKNRIVFEKKPLCQGYLFVQTIYSVAAWQGLMSFDGVAGLLMDGDFPARVSNARMQKMADEIRAFVAIPKAKRSKLFYKGSAVEIIKGSFAGFPGEALCEEGANGRLKVDVSIFGRSTICDFGIDSVRLRD